jgi:hypothetical protein
MESIFWIIALVSTGALALQVILSLVGIDFDHDFDVDLPGNGDVSLSAVLALLSAGSWGGLLGSQAGFSWIGTLLGALVSGGVGFLGAVLAINKIKKLAEKGNVEVVNAIGQTAEVYLGIPAGREGKGQIQVLIQGRLVTIDAQTDGEAIQTGDKVLVYAVEEDVCMVTRYDGQLTA